MGTSAYCRNIAPMKNEGCEPRGWHSLPAIPRRWLVHRYRRFVVDNSYDSFFRSEAACLLTQPVSVASCVRIETCFMLRLRSPAQPFRVVVKTIRCSNLASSDSVFIKFSVDTPPPSGIQVECFVKATLLQGLTMKAVAENVAGASPVWPSLRSSSFSVDRC